MYFLLYGGSARFHGGLLDLIPASIEGGLPEIRLPEIRLPEIRLLEMIPEFVERGLPHVFSFIWGVC